MKDSNISGIGGWLLILIIGLMVFPVMMIDQVVNSFRQALLEHPELYEDSQWENYRNASYAVFAISGIFSFISGWCLWKIHSFKSIRLSIFSIWLFGPVRETLNMIIVMVIFGKSINPEIAVKMIGNILFLILLASIWTLYLYRSTRVVNTYIKNKS